jgi:hydrogenase expression/formation protein HypE
LGLVMAEGMPVQSLRQVLDSVRQTAGEARVQVVAGDTKVVPDAGRLGLCINTTGIGVKVCGRRFRLEDARSGDAVIVTGNLGNHEIAVLSVREGLGFEHRVRSDTLPLAGLILPLLAKHDGIHALRDPTRGGLAGVLLDLADASDRDVFVDINALPVQLEVAAACEMLGLEPFDLVNEGKMVLVVSAPQAAAVLEGLQAHEAGREATIVGHLLRKSERSPRVVLAQQGLERVLVRREGAPYPRLC